MSETLAEDAATSAGALLRAARAHRNVSLDGLAATLKVSARKLEALEFDRLDELPDPAFTRALASAVCRALRIDPAPVLARLPRMQIPSDELEHVTTGLRTPFQTDPGRAWGGGEGVRWPVLLGAGSAVLGLAALVWMLLVPDGVSVEPAPSSASALPAAGAASEILLAPASSASGVWPSPPAALGAVAAGSGGEAAVVAPASVAASVPSAAASAAALAPPVAGSTLRVTARTWAELRDGGGRLLWSRTLDAGESVTLVGASPLRLVIGNAGAATLVHTGRRVDLAPWTRDNVARVELQ